MVAYSKILIEKLEQGAWGDAHASFVEIIRCTFSWILCIIFNSCNMLP